LTEKLKEEEKIELSRETIRKILRCEGISTPRRRRTAKHRSRRERRAAEGMMLQVDGSPHDWLEGRGPSLCLIGAIDDASAKVVGAFFVEAESSCDVVDRAVVVQTARWLVAIDSFRAPISALYELVEPRALFCIAERTSTL
jgi:hypothetical protein